LCQYANYKKANGFELCKLTLAGKCGLSAKATKYACDDLQDAGLLVHHSEKMKNGRQGDTCFELRPGVPLYKGGTVYNGTKDTGRSNRSPAELPMEQKTHGKTPCPMEQKTHGKRQNRTSSMTKHKRRSNKQRFSCEKQAQVKDGVEKSEKAACANAPLSDFTQKETAIGPAAFFAGVDS
jgi:hypothetical protein